MMAVLLGDLCDITVGRTPSRAKAEFWGPGEPWLSIADMNQGLRILATKEQITSEAARGGRRIEPGTVLLSFKLSIGKVAIAGVPLFTNEAIAALPIKDPESVHSAYLLRALQNADLAGRANRAAMGATLNKAALQAIRVPLPGFPEQRRIAAILDQADALRATRCESLSCFDQLNEALFHDLFGGRGDPEVRLDQLVDAGERLNYGVVQPGAEVPDGVPLIRVSDLADGRVDRTGLKRISAAIESDYGRSRIRGTEILVSCVGSIGTVSVVSAKDIGSNVARAVARVPIADPITRSYVAAYLRTEPPQRYFRAELRTVAQPTLNIKQLAATSIPIPPRALQERFLAHLAVLLAQRAAAQRSLDLLDELFASLQARAFSGRL